MQKPTTIIYEILMEPPPSACEMQVGYVKVAFYDRSKSLRPGRLTTENLCPSATVVRVHDSALAEEYTI